MQNMKSLLMSTIRLPFSCGGGRHEMYVICCRHVTDVCQCWTTLSSIRVKILTYRLGSLVPLVNILCFVCFESMCFSFLPFSKMFCGHHPIQFQEDTSCFPLRACLAHMLYVNNVGTWAHFPDHHHKQSAAAQCTLTISLAACCWYWSVNQFLPEPEL